MILALLILATDSCSFETAFRAGASEAEDSSSTVSVESICEGVSAEKRKEAMLAFELARDNAAVLKKAELQKIPTSYDEYNDLMELADRKIKLQALKDEVADRDLRIQQMKIRLQKNSRLSN
jgi:hypothetical protein